MIWIGWRSGRHPLHRGQDREEGGGEGVERVSKCDESHGKVLNSAGGCGIIKKIFIDMARYTR